RDPGARLGAEVQRRALLRILAVAKRAEAWVQDAAKSAPFRRGLVNLAAEPVGDRRVIGRGAGEGLLSHSAAESETGRSLPALQFVDQRRIVVHIYDDHEIVVVLGRGADHGGSAGM